MNDANKSMQAGEPSEFASNYGQLADAVRVRAARKQLQHELKMKELVVQRLLSMCDFAGLAVRCGSS